MTKKHRVLAAGAGITVCAGILVLRILLASSYLTQEKVFTPFALVSLAWLAAVIAVWKITKGQTYATLLTATGAVLSTANTAVIPLLHYTSLDDSDPEGLVLGLAQRVSWISIGALLLIPITWAGMYFLEYLYRSESLHLHMKDEPEWIRCRQRRKPHISPQNLLCIAVGLVSMLFAGVVLVFSSGGTTSVGNIQMLSIMAYALCRKDECNE